MPKKQKTIVTEGKYWIPSLNSGKGGYKDITKEDIDKWAGSAKGLQSAGHKIPAPWKHTTKAVPVVVGDDGTDTTSYENGGYWDTIWSQKNGKTGKQELRGVIDAPGSEDDPSSPFGKLGSTVQDTSIYIRDTWKDGKGKTWKEPVMHIALCTHPIEPGQDNFKPVQGGLVVAMSMATSEAMVPDLLVTLRNSVGIVLPEDTNTKNFLERLHVALLQKTGDGAGTTTKPPQGAREAQPPLIAMSFSDGQLNGMLIQVNPDTGANWTKEEIEKSTGQTFEMSSTPPVVEKVEPPNPNHDAKMALMMSMLNKSESEKRITRVTALINSGRITEEYAKEYLEPQLDGFKMSFGSNNEPLPHELDTLLVALEAAPAPIAHQDPDQAGSSLFQQLSMSSTSPPAGSSVVTLPQATTDNPPWKNQEEVDTHLASVFDN